MELYELIEDLRLQMQAAAASRKPHEIAFGAQKIVVELSFLVEKTDGHKIAAKLITADQSSKLQQAHKITLELSVSMPDGASIPLSSGRLIE